MKHTRLALALAITSLTATPVIAASVTMLQFGSFETRDEAEKRLSEVKSKHAKEISGLASSIREVKLPPDNLPVYRTQAGPVENRAAAQSICAKLAATGDECYIVQTAMVNAPTAPVLAEAKPAINASASVLPEPAAPLAQTKPAEATPDVTSKLSSLQDTPRDSSSRAMLSSVNGSMNASDTAPADAPIANSPEMQAALDKAIANQDEVTNNIVQTTNNASESAKSSRGFWSRLNPFSEDEPEVAAAAPAPEPMPEAAPVEPVTVAAAEPITAKQEQPVEPVMLQPAATPAPVAAPAPEPAVIANPDAMQLPPPPAPLKAQNDMMAKPLPPQPPVATGKLPPMVPLPPQQLAPANGRVDVEEAKRVPVTETVVAPVMAAPPAIVTKQLPPLQPPVSLRPSATDGQKTLWAQIGPFATQEAALNFWSGYRQMNPDFPVVRVRVTTPYQQASAGVQQSWLRIGPVARMGFIKSLCGSLNPGSNLRCGRVVDMGVTSSLKRAPGQLPASRYQR